MTEPSEGRPISVVVPLPPSYRGGTEEYAYRLVERFSPIAPVEVFTTSVRWNPRAAALPTGAAPVTRMRAIEIAERPLVVSPFARLRFSLHLERSSVLHLHMPFPAFERSAVSTAQDAGVPSILTYHMDADLSGVEDRWSTRTLTRLYRRFSAHPALEGAGIVVSNSRGYAEASPVLSRHLNKVRVVPKGVDPERLGLPSPRGHRPRPPSVPPELVPPGRARVLFVGRLVPYKGLPVLLDAFEQLVRDDRDVALLVAGKGPLADSFRLEVMHRGLDRRVGHLGFVPDSELGDLYRFADVVAAPSIGSLESTATALEEAAACGTPVAGSALPGTSESVPNDGERGRLVRSEDPYALAAAIAALLDQPRPSPPTTFRSWNDVARDYWGLYRELGAELPPFPDRAPTRAPSPAPVAALPYLPIFRLPIWKTARGPPEGPPPGALGGGEATLTRSSPILGREENER